MDHFNKLTSAEAERLDLLAEECAEVIQAVSKIKRHGYQSRHPNGGPTNQESLEKELGHVRLSIWLMTQSGDLRVTAIDVASWEKQASIQQWLHHNIVPSKGVE